MKRFFAVIALALATQSHAVTSAAPEALAWQTKGAGQFLVSVTLRKDVTGKPEKITQVKLVHAVVQAASADAAIGLFTRQALAQYPDYALMDTIVTAVPNNCGFQANI
ncbi:hypothetical protein [Cupriavidus pauculus]|uniref:hypothetical protein n=1 Tax=Cupriavidus pauculus TaxID=82633 RepID=UPI0038579EDE